MARAVTDDDFRRSALVEEQLALQRFTWDNVAMRALEACGDLWSTRGLGSETGPMTRLTTTSRTRDRVAWFSPMPPQPSGIADYSARLIHELARHVDVDVFVDGLVRDYESPGSDRITLRPVRSFRFLDAVGAYDEVVYCMGNSEFHVSAYEALLERSGVVLAHEVRFSGFYSWYSANRSADATLFQRSLAAQHPNVPLDLGARGWITVDEAERFGIYMVSELVEKSTRFLVHSRYAADVAALNAEAQSERISVVPFGILEPVSTVSFDSADPLVVTMGIAAEVKRTEAFVQAIPKVLESLPEARFAIVGGFAPPEFEGVIEELAVALGIAGRLTITGHVNRSEYDSWLRRATCAVQLRATSNGETSAAIADCLRNGVPTIVTGIGPAREYPSGSVYSIPAQATAREIGEAIVEVASDAELAHSFANRGLKFACASTFEAASLSILDALGLRSVHTVSTS
jgi:glycosyltransferase involved in cell wall biosynthesis